MLGALADTEQAHRCFRQGDFASAAALYARALRAAPTPAQALALHSNRAACFLKLRNLPKAAEECGAALVHDPDHAGVLLLRAQTLQMMKDYQGALNDVTHLLALKPESPSYLALRSRLHALQEGEFADILCANNDPPLDTNRPAPVKGPSSKKKRRAKARKSAEAPGSGPPTASGRVRSPAPGDQTSLADGDASALPGSGVKDPHSCRMEFNRGGAAMGLDSAAQSQGMNMLGASSQDMAPPAFLDLQAQAAREHDPAYDNTEQSFGRGEPGPDEPSCEAAVSSRTAHGSALEHVALDFREGRDGAVHIVTMSPSPTGVETPAPIGAFTHVGPLDLDKNPSMPLPASVVDYSRWQYLDVSDSDGDLEDGDVLVDSDAKGPFQTIYKITKVDLRPVPLSPDSFQI
eukprot:SM000116S24247  [mRNA]  locus=s116:443901:445841:+ [translate_table: standard]